MIDIPSELVQVQEDVILTLDGMTVNSLKFLTTISKHLYYRTAPCHQQQQNLIDQPLKM